MRGFTRQRGDGSKIGRPWIWASAGCFLLAFAGCGRPPVLRLSATQLSSVTRATDATAAIVFEFPADSVTKCAIEQLGSASESPGAHKLYLADVCENRSTGSSCRDDPSYPTPALATLTGDKVTMVEIDPAANEADFESWIKKHFPHSLWHVASEQSYGESLGKVADRELGC